MVDVAPLGAPRRQLWRGGFTSEAEAKAILLATVEDSGARSHPGRASESLARYLQGWLERKGRDGTIRASTWKTYDVAIRVHINPAIGAVPLRKLTRPQIATCYDQLAIKGRARGGPGGLSPKTVYSTHLCLHLALKDAVEEGLIGGNPSDRARHAPAIEPEMLYWSADELRHFIHLAEPEVGYPLWRVAAFTGMRRGELLGLAWRDVDLDRRRLHIRNQLQRERNLATSGLGPGVPKTRVTRIREVKTRAARRSISLDAGTVATLGAVARVQAQARRELGTAYRSELDLVFCRPDGTPHNPDVITHQFARELRLHPDVRRIRLQDLRHTHATICLVAGIHPKIVQVRLGHSSIKVTMDRYSHVLPALDEEAADRVADLVDHVRSVDRTA